MSTVKLISCTVREADPGVITGEVSYSMSFTETELRLDLGFVATLFVTPSNLLTKATRTTANGMTDAKTSYRVELPVILDTLRPSGQSTIVKTASFTVAKNSLFIDLSAAQLSEEQTKSTTWQRPVWSKANAWDQTVAGLDVRLELNLDIGSAPKIESADLRFANRPALGPVTTTTRSGIVGGTGGSAFADTLPANTLQISRFITFGDTKLTAIQIEWKDTSGQITKSPVRGATYNPVQEFVFEPGEYITEVSGFHQGVLLTASGLTFSDKGVRVVDSIEFLTNFKRKFGPVGAAREKSLPYLFTGLKVVGLFGCCGGNVDQLGFISRAEVTPVATATPTALEFNGVDTYIEVNAALPITNQVTLEMWMRGIPKEAFLFFLTDDGRAKRLLSAHVPYPDNNVYLDGGGDASNNYDRINKSLGTPDDKNVWNHWAFVRNSGTGRMAIYKNGALFHEQATGLTRSMAGSTRLVIGAAGDGNWPHAGAISELRLWNVERTAAQLNDNIKRVIAGAETGLIASYSLDGYQAGQPISDRSGGGRHGTVRGTSVSVAGPSALVK